MSEKTAKKTAAKSEAKSSQKADAADVKNNTLAHPIDRSILVGPSTADLNPAYEVEHD